jgi:hypothetical protein
MGLLDNLSPLHAAKPCKVGTIINGLEPEDAHILDLALKNMTDWSNRALAHALQSRGISVTTDTIRAHRLNTCPCRRLA